MTAGPSGVTTLRRESEAPAGHGESTGPLVQGFGEPREPAAVPVWSTAAAAEPVLLPSPGAAEPAVPDSPESDSSESDSPESGGPRVSRRPRSGLLVALFVFYCLQLAAAAVTWREAPIRTDALVDPMVAYAICAALVIPAFLLRGKWRILPALLAAAAGTLTPILLARDLMKVVGPRDVWVGQSLTLQVLFPLVVGLSAVVALLTTPRRVS